MIQEKSLKNYLWAIGGQVLVPAAAVIPTPRVSMMDAAVKESVVVYAMKKRRLSALSLL